ncbi:uncharacterized protein N7473_012717 [Penicillium subrubescens]|uniref:uncharacterized protein n=1 Tax=Penicillium subrubescens TaxID=1316194 RepID=UPI002544DE0F|nr:uncharacterized protein N7473_012717 [Penicillium subrubescens]KAJ5875370.1 hypothetical protein N7473_012717 [Penicillium subrubescens]
MNSGDEEAILIDQKGVQIRPVRAPVAQLRDEICTSRASASGGDFDVTLGLRPNQLHLASLIGGWSGQLHYLITSLIGSKGGEESPSSPEREVDDIKSGRP